MSTPFPPPSLPTSAAGVGLGYGIAIAVGLLVLISTILLASYLCARSKSPLPISPSSPLPPPPSSSPPNFVVGLDLYTIDAFYPKFVHQYSGQGDNKNNAGAGGDDACPICLGEYVSGDVLRRGPDCGHCFHVACVDEWLRLSATCPLCRSSPVLSPVATPLSELIPLARTTTRGR
ncbi:putative RING-H2 finger protein ATL69 [Carex rostrata]